MKKTSHPSRTKPTWRAAVAVPALFLCALAAPTLHAQSYPNKPVKVVVPFPPGGGTDAVARIFSARFSEALGQPFIIENRAGATGMIGTKYAASATPDGYTLLMGSLSSHLLAPLAVQGNAADPVNDFEPIGMLAYHPMVLNVHPSVKANTVAELVEETKGGKPMFYASMGNGSLFHLAGAVFNAKTGAKSDHVGYKGAGPAMNDLLGGQVQFMFDTIQSSLPHLQANKLKALAVIAKERSPLLPDVPTIAEAGVSDIEMVSWVGMFAPAKTPQAIIDKLASTLADMSRDTAFIEQMRKSAAVVPSMTPAEFKQSLIKEQKSFTEQYKLIDIK